MKIGDAVSVIDENLHGIVKSVRGATVNFTDEHGFSYTYSAQRLVKVEEALYDQIPVHKEEETPKKSSKKHSKNVFVVDLHYDKLAPKTPGSAAERFFLQREKLQESVEFCRKHRLKKMEIIHGIGNGTLQKLVCDYLTGQMGLTFYHKETLPEQSGAVIVEFN